MMNCRFSIGDPIPSRLTDRHTDLRANSKRAGTYCVVAASVRGRLHEHSQTPRDDAFVARGDGTWLAAAVSDGLGSRPLSRYGASFAVNRLCTSLLRSVTHAECHTLDQTVRDAFCKTRAGIEQFAAQHDTPLDDLHCTLLGIILNTETGMVGMGQIGDGLILGLTDEKEAITLLEPPAPDEVGATYVFTQDNWEQYFHSAGLLPEEAKRFRTLYLMTDGVADDCQYGPPADILERWANDMDREIRMFPPPKTAQRLRRYLATYQVRGSFDDRTLVAVYRQEDNHGF